MQAVPTPAGSEELLFFFCRRIFAFGKETRSGSVPFYRRLLTFSDQATPGQKLDKTSGSGTRNLLVLLDARKVLPNLFAGKPGETSRPAFDGPV